MDELIDRLAAKAGVDKSVAEKMVLAFLRKKVPPDHVQVLLDNIPGAENAIDVSGSGNGFASMLGVGVMALGAKLTGVGLGVSGIQTIGRELFSFGRDKIGADAMNAIIAETPGLSQFA